MSKSLTLCHPERSRTIRNANLPAQSRDLALRRDLFHGASRGHYREMIQPRRGERDFRPSSKISVAAATGKKVMIWNGTRSVRREIMAFAEGIAPRAVSANN